MMFDKKLLFVGLTLSLVGCPAEEENMDTGADTGGATDTDPTGGGSTTGEELICYGGGGPGAAGSACTSNDDCMSGICLLYQDTPPDDDAVCAEETVDCATRITGTLYDFSEIVDNGNVAPLSGSNVNIVKATDALTNAAGATPLASSMSDGMGRIDAVSDGPISAPIAIIAIAGGGDYHLTATGVASEIDEEDGRYEMGTGLHEFWAVRNSTINDWSSALEDDTEAAAALGDGLGVSGGVVGFVRDSMGNPVEGAVVTSDSDASGATIRYPQADGTMGTEMTDASGTFIILEPSPTGEDFTAEANGMSGGNTAGTAPNVIFSMIITL